MPVGVGLDHRERPGTADLAGEAVVVAQGFEVDQGTGGTHGGYFIRLKKSPAGVPGQRDVQACAATTIISTSTRGS